MLITWLVTIVVFMFVLGGLAGPRGHRSRFRWQFRLKHFAILIGVLAYVFALMRARPHDEVPLMFLGGLVLAVLFVRTWISEFRQLMARPDDAFPGRNDKLIWAFVLLAMAPIGVWMFRNFRLIQWPEPEPQADPQTHPFAEPA